VCIPSFWLDDRQEEAQQLHEAVNLPLQAFDQRHKVRSGGEARMKKALMELIGHPMGASRPPSLPLDERELADLRNLVSTFGWPLARR
jgi:dihydrodipicolinate synthase/N-acetylneuraminate lyase